MNTQICNSVKSMPPVVYAGSPVITTGIMASLYDTDEANIKMNFSRNAERFVEGKHYFKLEGVDLKEFKNKVTKSYSVESQGCIVGKRARSLTLWTERGAARHAKMLDTDQAWDVFEALEDFYFCKKEEAEKKPNFRQSTAKELIPLRQTAERLIAHGVGNIYPDIWKHVHAEFGVQHINELLPEQIPLAISYLDVLEGEYIPRQEEPNLSEMNVRTLYSHMKHIVSLCKEQVFPPLIMLGAKVETPLRERIETAACLAFALYNDVERKTK